MNKYVIGIDGLKCGMCEAHIENIIRKNMKIDKIKASHHKNTLIVITELDLSLDDFHIIIDPTGYRITSFNKQDALKGLFGYKL